MILNILFAAALLGGSIPATTQDDDWEYEADPAQQISVAAVRYEGGQMIAAQCQNGRLRLAVTGLGQAEDTLHLTAQRADGRTTTQAWVSIAPGVYRSASPGRDSRFLRGGGTYSLSSEHADAPAIRASFDLPTASANLERVLVDCGWALEDDRDLLPEAEEIVLDRPRRGRAAPPIPYRAPAHPEREVSCIVRGMRLQDCRGDHPASARDPDVRSLIRSGEGRQVFVPDDVDAAATEGKVFHMIASNMLLLVVHR